MTLREFLRGLSDARGLDEDAFWTAAQHAEKKTGCDSIRGFNIAKAQDLIIVQFSYYSIGLIGAGHAVVHDAPSVVIVGQFSDETRETPTKHATAEILDVPLEDWMVLMAERANMFRANFEKNKWPEDSPQAQALQESVTEGGVND